MRELEERKEMGVKIGRLRMELERARQLERVEKLGIDLEVWKREL